MSLNKFAIIENHLKQLKISYKIKDDQILINYKFHTINYSIKIFYTFMKTPFICIKTRIADLEKLSQSEKLLLLETALQINYDYPEITFSKNNHELFLEIDCLPDIDFDDFKAEFYSIPQGIKLLNDYLMTVPKKFRRQLIGNLNLGTDRTKELINEIISQIENLNSSDIRDKIINEISGLVDKFREKSTSGSNPKGILAAVIYFVSNQNGIKATQQNIARVCKISDDTLRNRLKEIKTLRPNESVNLNSAYGLIRKNFS